jgi:nucleotide-binding universal stress UspA family protein
MLLGSVAESVARHATVPVLLIRERAGSLDGGKR